jgi:hypothetical protein
MKKGIISVAAILLTHVFLAQPALPWGSATHAYIMDHIGKTAYWKNLNEIYGSMAPDMFNLMFEPQLLDVREYMWEQTHRHPNFMKVWDAAHWWGYQKPLAYGFVSHNDSWAADFTAHHRSRLYWINGYVIVKAHLLEAIFDLTSFLEDQFGIIISEEAAIELWHNLVEVAGDIIIWRNDHLIGEKIFLAAQKRSNAFQQLLIDAYANDLANNFPLKIGDFTEASAFLVNKEIEFQNLMKDYGGILALNNEDNIIRAFAVFAAELYGPQLGIHPSDPRYGDLITQAENLLRISLLFIQNDYMREINRTTKFVKIEMLAHWIFYF